MERDKKPMRISHTYHSKLVLPGDANNHDTLFGGLLMKYIDEVAAMAALRHARKECVTASNDGVHFHRPIRSGHMIDLEAYVSSVGHTSMEIFVKIITEDTLTGERQIAATSFLTFVALDAQRKPTQVSDVYPETEEEKMVYKDREKRKKARKEKQRETNKLIQQLSLHKK